ncbi:MAG TPA: hypothetical protein VGZ02_13715 [Candidatus Baltobacteraceae bacterium]|jgi:hypothetical protein|nr:hypothetical protein [Candidatus Baltobacteraceae bacterium]
MFASLQRLNRFPLSPRPLLAAGALLALQACGAHLSSPPGLSVTSNGYAGGAPISISTQAQPSARSVTVVATRAGQSVTRTFDCASGTCSGALAAASGTNLFTIELWSGRDGTGTMLSRGAAYKTLSAAEPVRFTFTHIVGSVRLNFTTDNPGMPRLADKVGPSSVQIVVDAETPSGQTIVGSGTFVDSAGKNITIKILDSDSSTTVSPASFTGPQPGGPNTTTLSLGATVSPFEDPQLTPSIVFTATGKTDSSVGARGMDVLVSPVADVGSHPQSLGGPGGGGPVMTSMYGADTLQLAAFSFTEGLYEGNAQCIANGNDTDAPVCPPFIHDVTQGPDTVICCGANSGDTPITPVGNVQDHLIHSSPIGGGSDNTFWFADEPNGSNGALSYADATTDNAQNDIVALPNAAPVAAMLANKNYIWLGENQSGAPPTVEAFSAASPPATLKAVPLPGDQSGGVLDGMDGGPSNSVLVVVSKGGTTYVDKLALPGPAVVSEFSVSLTLQTLTNGWQPIVGYSPKDGNLYAVDNGTGTVWEINLTTHAVTKMASDGPPITSGDPNLKRMSPMPDGSLVFEGATPTSAYGPNPQQGTVPYYFAHIVPGRSPTPVSVAPPACMQAPCNVYALWSINVPSAAASTDGGNTHAMVW